MPARAAQKHRRGRFVREGGIVHSNLACKTWPALQPAERGLPTRAAGGLPLRQVRTLTLCEAPPLRVLGLQRVHHEGAMRTHTASRACSRPRCCAWPWAGSGRGRSSSRTTRMRARCCSTGVEHACMHACVCGACVWCRGEVCHAELARIAHTHTPTHATRRPLCPHKNHAWSSERCVCPPCRPSAGTRNHRLGP